MKTVMETIPYGPTRVIVDGDGLGVTSNIAREKYNIDPDIIFLRNDEWSLGAPTKYENVAYSIWASEWTHFVRKGNNEWISINEYYRK
jgi:hypothetical protein